MTEAQQDPYEPPKAKLAEGRRPKVEEIVAFVGANVSYYLAAWTPVLEDASRLPPFNWAAGLFTTAWFAYRRMYGLVAVFTVVTVIASFLEEAAAAALAVEPGAKLLMDLLFLVCMTVVGGRYGNLWYLNFARREIARARSSEHSDVYGELARRGGGRWIRVLVSAIVVSLLGFLLATLVVMAIGPS